MPKKTNWEMLSSFEYTDNIEKVKEHFQMERMDYVDLKNLEDSAICHYKNKEKELEIVRKAIQEQINKLLIDTALL